MKRSKAEDIGIKGMLKDEYDRCAELVEQIKQTLSGYPRGQLVVKKIKSKNHVYEYYHLQWRQGAKVLSKHVPQKEIPEVKIKIEQREAYQKSCISLEKRISYLAPLIGESKPRKSFRSSSKGGL